MIEYSESSVPHVSVHRVGNKITGEELVLSGQPLDIKGDLLEKSLLSYFLSNFTSPEYYHFVATTDDLLSNAIFQFASGIFLNKKSFHKNSVSIATKLYEVTQHANVKSGDLFVAYLSKITIDNQVVDAIGIFKSENKDSYLKLYTAAKSFNLEADTGINIKKLDKACLILNIETETGYKVLAVDNTNKSNTAFWVQDFLQVKPCPDNFHRTKKFMELTRQYVDDQLDEDFRVSKADKIGLLNRSMDFFKSRDQFNQPEFEAEVLADPSVIESFRNYGRTSNDTDLGDNFEISAPAVKKQIRVFKSVIKLDKNFHIYVHANRPLIEKGFDEAKNKHYYKLYFDEEN